MKTLGKLAAVAFAATLPVSAHAATIDLDAAGYMLEGTSLTVTEVDVVLGGGSLLALDGFALGVLSSFDVTSAPDFDFSADSDGLATNVMSGSGGTEVQSMLGMIQVLFEGISASGSFGAFDGDAVLVTLTQQGLDAPNDFTSVGTGELTFEVLKPLAPIPVPAGGILLVTALGALVVSRRRA